MGRTRKKSVGAKLLRKISKQFSRVPDSREPTLIKIPMLDTLLSGFAVFSLKFPSLLQFEEAARTNASKLRGTQSVSNLRNLYGIRVIPSDTQMRSILDEVDPEELRPIFKVLFSDFQRSK